MLELLLILLPVAAVLGWYWGRYHPDAEIPLGQSRFPKEYIASLNFLLNDQTDKAVELFIKMLEVDSETVETHLALGNLFRRRGEIARAIRVHQNLIARPQLLKQQRIEAQQALAQDYLSAGMLDRAERLFLEIIEAGEQDIVSFRHLMDIYQQQKNWEKAIEIAQKLQRLSEPMQVLIAHFYCELALDAKNKGYSEQFHRYLKQALQADKHCVRASLLQAESAVLQQQWQAAIEAYQRVKEQDPDYLSEAITPMAECYQHLPAEHIKLLDYLGQCLQQYPRISIVLLIADYLQKLEGNRAAVEFIAEQLHQHPSVRGLQHLIELQLLEADGKARADLLTLKDLTASLLQNKPIYRCHQCGFQGQLLHWQCPGCKGWSTVRPIHGLEGD